MENINKDYMQIEGWGVDADPENDPTYPMKHRTNEEHKGYHWERSEQQPALVEILHSNERPNLSAVFGTSAPPKGLSGMIRRYAFRYSEGSFAHWIPLIMADRVNVIEGIIDDLKRGRFPNIWAEKGLKARWKYDKKKIFQNIGAGTLLISGVAGFLFWKINTIKA
ncbi:MAG: hypothetical protein K2X86_06420 [Cytophagaceae bacterium]|nr:hypothetical protein [Cytophagaceae bacterium]